MNSALDDKASSAADRSDRHTKSSVGTCRVFNRDVLASMAVQAEMDAEPMSRPRSISPKKKKPETGTKKRQDMINKLAETRAKDQRFIKEQVDHHKEMREQRFERLLGSVTGDDMYLKGYVTEMLRTQNLQYSKRVHNMFQEWNAKIYENLQGQLDTILNPMDRKVLQSLSGERNVDFKIPDQKPVIRCNPTENPAYKQLLKNHKECDFRRKMDHLVYPNNYPHNGSLAKSAELDHNNLNANLRYLDSLDANAAGFNADDIFPPMDPRRARSKPVLEPELWGQLALQGTPYGHFAQVCAHGEGFKTSVKRGNHVPSQEDGVPPAGTRKTRWTRNDVGMLKGEIANRGETIQYKTSLGASNGAPGQDHFTYEGGTRVVDTEFPLGKQMFPHKH